ncbi:hypothetical protein X560_0857 [Listeria fleischmannii 1991]|jgi:hypothetical protein|uniref:Uncharacterized protein n=2 Tax=Listeria fleischmannii TaxID=1069827 RepID=A0A2X3GPZ9_9LIST|nr:hypothetical protein [Listeria fleischmannii]EMG27664.1 hypothetical protein LFLEISCH_09884 [Listeria fleischmannii subsp. fleischmannii LU2006-1]KMT60351.1 hypothetical protein X560_0857 [Listeria fleischmannii 1991]SQC70448.1 Uncharacterised protein [Listeria fleischmannii subsp. fleischmannii]
MDFINPWDERFIYTITFTSKAQPKKILKRTIVEKDMLDESAVLERWLEIFPNTNVTEVVFLREALERNEQKYRVFKAEA